MREKTVIKYMSALEAIKNALDVNPKVSLTQLCTNMKVNKAIPKHLGELGIIEKRETGRYWTGVEPSEALARDVINKHAIQRDPIPEAESNPVEQPTSNGQIDVLIEKQERTNQLLEKLCSYWGPGEALAETTS